MKHFSKVLLLLLVAAAPALGQNYALAPNIKPTFLDQNGNPIAYGKLCSYAAGTTNTPQATYSDSIGTPNTNPILLTAGGVPAAGAIYLGGGSYNFVLRRQGSDGAGTCPPGPGAGAQIWSQDHVADPAVQLLNGTLTIDIASISTAVLNDRQFCDQSPGATASAKIAACIAALPATGGTADATGLDGAQSWTGCPFTGVTKPATVILGAGVSTLTTLCTVPASIDLVMPAGAVVQASSGALTVLGSLTATLGLHFTGNTPNLTAAKTRDIYPQWFGAKGDAQKVMNCNMTAGFSTVTCLGSAFTSADVGKLVDMQAAGPSGTTLDARGAITNLTGTIGGVGDATHIDLSAPAVSSATGKILLYGSDDAPAIQAALTAGAGKVVFFPGGNYVVGSGFTLSGTHAHTVFQGDGRDVSTIYAIGPRGAGTGVFNVFTLNGGADNITVASLGLSGTNWNGDPMNALFILEADGVVARGANGNHFTAINSRFDSFWVIGLHAEGNPTGWQITGSQADHNGFDGMNLNATNLVVSGNLLTYNGTGGIEAGSKGALSITGNTLRGNRGANIAVGGFTSSGDVGYGYIVSGNTVVEGTQGIVIASNVQGANISGNTIHKMDVYGIILAQGAIVSTTPTKNNLVSGNLITAVGCVLAAACSTGHLPANFVTAGIYVDNDLNTIQDNVILRAPTEPNFQQYAGVAVLYGDGNTVVRNTVRDSLGPDYLFDNASVGTVFDRDTVAGATPDVVAGGASVVYPTRKLAALTMVNGPFKPQLTAALPTTATVDLGPILPTGNILPYAPTSNATVLYNDSLAFVPVQEFTLIIATNATSYTLTFTTRMRSAGPLVLAAGAGLHYIMRWTCDGVSCYEISRTAAQ